MTDGAPAPRNADILALWRALERIDPRKDFIRGEHDTLGYGEVRDQGLRFTRLFATLGLGAGERVVVATHDDLALAALFLALLRNGITAVVLNPEARTTELARLLDAADPKALFVDAALADRLLPEQREAWPIVRVEGDTAAPRRLRLFGRKERSGPRHGLAHAIASLEPLEPPAAVDPEATAYILFTSGTTSRPKGVEISHRSLFAQMGTFVRQYGFDADTRLMNLLPLHHTDGLTQGVTVAFSAGATLLRPMRIRVNLIGEILHACHETRATHLIAVPSMLALMVNLGEQYHDVFRSRWFRFVISTAAYLDEGLWRRFETLFGTRVVNVYGLTETVCESIYCGPDDATRRLGTIGKPVDSEARIVDDAGRALPPGETGELALRGEHVMKGYFRLPDETAAVMRDGWFLTGDLAVADADGFYQIVGRKKDVIISAGLNIYPEDVNAVLRTVPGIVDAATISMPDEQWGERVVCGVVARPGARPTEEQIAQHFLAHASPEKLPREIHFFDDLPRGPAGKVVKADLRRAIEDRRAAQSVAATAGSLEERVRAIAARSFKCAPEALSLESTPQSVDGWTSLAHVEFLMALELEFSFTLSPADIMRIGKLDDARRLVQDKIEA